MAYGPEERWPIKEEGEDAGDRLNDIAHEAAKLGEERRASLGPKSGRFGLPSRISLDDDRRRDSRALRSNC